MRSPSIKFSTWKDKRWKWYPCPGWKGDPLKRFGKFDRWQNRPPSSWRLYWTTHPEAYAAMCANGQPGPVQ